MVVLAEQKDYLIKQFSSDNFQQIASWVSLKITQHQHILIIHENIHYLESHRSGSQAMFNSFADQLYKIVKENP